MKTPFKRVISYVLDTGGNIVVPAAVALCALTAIVGGVIDMSAIEGQKKSLQVLADNAALSAAREFAISANNGQRIEESAKAFVTATAKNPNISAIAQAHMDVLTVEVTVRAPAKTFFPGPAAQVKLLSASATARLVGEAGNICMIGLSGDASNTIYMAARARITAAKCAIYSNSKSMDSIVVRESAQVTADFLYSAGGFKGAPTDTMKQPVTDAPQIGDPLAGRPMPRVGMCDENDFVVTDTVAGNRKAKKRRMRNAPAAVTKILDPGTYCGGLVINGGSVELRPGIYIIKDGPLEVSNGGSMVGENVGFFLTGDETKLNFEARSTVDLTAPKSGALTGMLFYANPANPPEKPSKMGKKLKKGHVIESDNARRLVGTIYLPDDKLVVDGNSPVADRSEYTVIIAKSFELDNGPNLVIQTNYDASDIPVPDGVGPKQDTSVRLLH
jgi:Putative Flp pilus-assembly TadE/G-like